MTLGREGAAPTRRRSSASAAPLQIPLTVTPSSFPQTSSQAQIAQAVDRPVRRPGHARCRWPWSSAGIANGGVVMQPYLVKRVRSLRPRHGLARRSPPSSRPRSRPRSRAQLTEMMEGVVAVGHRHQRADPRRRGGRQDRHRADRPRAAPARLVHRVRPRRRPEGRGRRRRRERRRLRRGRRPAAAVAAPIARAGHGGGARAMTITPADQPRRAVPAACAGSPSAAWARSGRARDVVLDRAGRRQDPAGRAGGRRRVPPRASGPRRARPAGCRTRASRRSTTTARRRSTGKGLAYLVMELVPGEALSAILAREGALGTDRTLDVVAQAAPGAARRARARRHPPRRQAGQPHGDARTAGSRSPTSASPGPTTTSR